LQGEERRSFFEKKEPKKLLPRFARACHRRVEQEDNEVFFAAFLFTKKQTLPFLFFLGFFDGF
jgi:hypothetical protein